MTVGLNKNLQQMQKLLQYGQLIHPFFIHLMVFVAGGSMLRKNRQPLTPWTYWSSGHIWIVHSLHSPEAGRNHREQIPQPSTLEARTQSREWLSHLLEQGYTWFWIICCLPFWRHQLSWVQKLFICENIFGYMPIQDKIIKRITSGGMIYSMKWFTVRFI